MRWCSGFAQRVLVLPPRRADRRRRPRPRCALTEGARGLPGGERDAARDQAPERRLWRARVLFDVSLEARREKWSRCSAERGWQSTTLKAIMGLIPASAGKSCSRERHSRPGHPPDRPLGLAMCPRTEGSSRISPCGKHQSGRQPSRGMAATWARIASTPSFPRSTPWRSTRWPHVGRRAADAAIARYARGQSDRDPARRTLRGTRPGGGRPRSPPRSAK